ncbi:tyrosine-type recombinase/integrase [Brevibacillus humidisoli]|uniref:tyrosine-type recombinase/integrase n=1 Tax=Brevibacillus humidisoli TaxID=2895522 RepID=UPI001E50B24B|nr:tyrosine-type recombinase/integrase [Brevibacillus humidisoli]
MAPILQEYLENIRPSGCDPHFFITKKTGTKMTTGYIRAILHKATAAAGISKKVTPHVLRHSFATSLYKDHGVDVNGTVKILNNGT